MFVSRLCAKTTGLDGPALTARRHSSLRRMDCRPSPKNVVELFLECGGLSQENPFLVIRTSSSLLLRTYVLRTSSPMIDSRRSFLRRSHAAIRKSSHLEALSSPTRGNGSTNRRITFPIIRLLYCPRITFLMAFAFLAVVPIRSRKGVAG